MQPTFTYNAKKIKIQKILDGLVRTEVGSSSKETYFNLSLSSSNTPICTEVIDKKDSKSFFYIYDNGEIPSNLLGRGFRQLDVLVEYYSTRGLI